MGLGEIVKGLPEKAQGNSAKIEVKAFGVDRLFLFPEFGSTKKVENK